MTEPILERECVACKVRKNLTKFDRQPDEPEDRPWFCKPCKKLLDYRYRRDLELRRLYGISLQEYERRLVKQQGRCAICRRLPRRLALAVDHDPATGRIRGLLCGRCNTALGVIGDCLEKAMRFIYYLRDKEMPHQPNGKRCKPFRVTVTRYVDETGRRAEQKGPGLKKITTKTRTYYIEVDGVRISLKTADFRTAVKRGIALLEKRETEM